MAAKLKEIENEMKNIGYWQADPLPQEAFDCKAAFCEDTMSFPQWLQFVLIPNANKIIVAKGDFPQESEVGLKAMRELGGNYEAAKLTALLSEFDDLFDSRIKPPARFIFIRKDGEVKS